MQTNFTRKAAQEPAHRRGRQDPAQLRALRLLHRHLPDLRAAGRRARQPARPHLPDEGDVRARPPGQPGGAAPRRPLPLLPLVHDHLPQRRRLHAPRRPRPRAHRGDRQARLQGARGPRPARGHPALSRAASAWRSGRRASRGPSPACCAGSGSRSWWPCSSWRRPGCCAAPTSPAPARPRPRPSAGKRVILLAGCAQQVLRPEINDATIRLLARRGVDVEVAPGAGCCGALVHHMGREAAAIAMAKRNIDAWTRLMEKGDPRRRRDRQRVGLRHHRQGLRPHAGARARVCRARRQDRRHDARRDRVPRQLRHGPAQALVVAAGRLSLGLLDAARPAHHPTSRASCCATPASRWSRCRRATCAAARPAPTTSCSPRSPPTCATARSPTSRACAPTWSRPATSAASPSSPAAWTSPSPTPWSCSTGPTAARCRAG